MSRPPEIRLDLGVPGWPPPPEAAEAAAACLGRPAAYGPPGGLPELREALAEKARDRNGIAAAADRVVVTTGASMAIVAILAARGSPEGRVLLPDPGYPAFTRMAQLLQLPVVHYPAGREDTLERLERIAAGGGPGVLLWNSPHNPTGAVSGPGEVRALLSLAVAQGLTVISDEVYEDFVFEGRHVSPAALAPEADVYTVFSFSKTFAMAGWRGGYVVAPPGAAAPVERAHWALGMNAPLPVQEAALAALRAGGTYLAGRRARLDAQRRRAADALAAEGIPFRMPEGAFFLWLRTEPTAGGDQFARLARERGRLALAPGAAFGPSSGGHVRLSFAGDGAELDVALRRLGALWRALRAAA